MINMGFSKDLKSIKTSNLNLEFKETKFTTKDKAIIHPGIRYPRAKPINHQWQTIS